MAGAPTKAQSQNVSLVSGERTVVLRWSWIALAALQDHWKLPTIDAVQQKVAAAASSMSIDDLIDVVWAALQSQHPETTVEDAKRIADDAGIAAMAEALGRLLNASTPPQEAAARGPTGTKRRS